MVTRLPTLVGQLAVNGVLRVERPAALGGNDDGVGVLTARLCHLRRRVGHQQKLVQVQRVRQNEFARVPTEVHHLEQQVVLENVDQFAVVEIAHVLRVDQDVVHEEVEDLQPHFDQLPVLVAGVAEELCFECHEVRRLEVSQAQLLFEQNGDEVGEAVENEVGQDDGAGALGLAAVVVHVVQEELEQLAHHEVLALVVFVRYRRFSYPLPTQFGVEALDALGQSALGVVDHVLFDQFQADEQHSVFRRLAEDGPDFLETQVLFRVVSHQFFVFLLLFVAHCHQILTNLNELFKRNHFGLNLVPCKK